MYGAGSRRRRGEPLALRQPSSHSGLAVARVALYGGAFDPPHLGHLFTVTWLLVIRIDRLLGLGIPMVRR